MWLFGCRIILAKEIASPRVGIWQEFLMNSHVICVDGIPWAQGGYSERKPEISLEGKEAQGHLSLYLKGIILADILRKYQGRVRAEEGGLLRDNYSNPGGESCGMNHAGTIGTRKEIYIL